MHTQTYPAFLTQLMPSLQPKWSGTDFVDAEHPGLCYAVYLCRVELNRTWQVVVL